ncbi:MAG TPA: helix-turn-helix domain-containing protein [Haliangiales bacterium]|nr:helix-turn-helix domain-containing protein [Haliangiales bacterium]
MPRLRRAEQVQRNRDLVIAAARRVFLARGYAGATLEAIADEAGFSKGVVYSQFESKGDLFMTLLERRIADRAAENERAVGSLAAGDAVRALLRAAERDAQAAAEWTRVLVEFRILAAREPELNRRYGDAHARAVDRLADLLRRLHARDQRRPAFPLRSMAELIFAFGAGTALERAANPAALPIRIAEGMLIHALGLASEAR